MRTNLPRLLKEHPEMAGFVQIWPTLPPYLIQTIVTLIEAHARTLEDD